jgi:hypothetical protein
MKQAALFISIFIICHMGFSQTPVTLFFQPHALDSFQIDYSITSVTEQDIMGARQSGTAKEDMSYRLKITEIKPNGNIIVQMICYKYRSDVHIGDLSQTFSGDSLNVTGAGYIKLFLNKPIYATLDPHGRIVEFDDDGIGIDTADVPDIDKSSIPITSGKFGEQIPKSILSLMHYPSTPPKTDQVWTSADTVFLFPFFYTDVRSSVTEFNENICRVKQTGKIGSDAHRFYKTNRIFITYELRGEVENSYSVDMTNGMLLEAEMQQHMTGSAGMKYSETSDTDYNWPITIQNVILLKTKKL